jgi:CHASE3 domain sensor protein
MTTSTKAQIKRGVQLGFVIGTLFMLLAVIYVLLHYC